MTRRVLLARPAPATGAVRSRTMGVTGAAGAVTAGLARSPVGCPYEEPSMDQREGQDDEEQDDPGSRRQAEIGQLEGRVVEVQHRRHQAVVGVTVDAAADEHLVEQLERPDERDRGHEVVTRSQQWERDAPERLPWPG